ncbi:ribonuclease III [Candidatus Saganbacteria bacterium]|nr:ribonuclease III [Candidatus Saganbacteria bacterium]
MAVISPEREAELHELQKKLGVAFLHLPLLNQSLTHSSFGHEQKISDNERLEFLGDAVLKLVISDYLYHKFPDRAEGDLTKFRATVISDETLANIGRQLDIGAYILMSANEKRTGGVKRKSNLANAIEALIGAVYLDAGVNKSRDLILQFLIAEVEKVSQEGFIRDYKSALQELTQKHKWKLPHYHVLKETGPKHRRVFWMEVKINDQRYGMGRGRNKKEAEQRAAMHALSNLRQETKVSAKRREPRETKGLRGIFSQVRKRMKI